MSKDFFNENISPDFKNKVMKAAQPELQSLKESHRRHFFMKLSFSLSAFVVFIFSFRLIQPDSENTLIDLDIADINIDELDLDEIDLLAELDAEEMEWLLSEDAETYFEELTEEQNG